MQITSIKQLIVVTFCVFIMQISSLLLADGLSSNNSTSTSPKSITFEQMKSKSFAAHLQIVPNQVDAPPRRIDLLPEPNHQSSVYTITGLPAKLREYPLLDFKGDAGSLTTWGADLALDTQSKGVADTLMHVGDPALFPDMIEMFFDFKSVEFSPKGLAYSLKRKVGLGYDNQWRYTLQNVALKQIAEGTVGATFAPGGDLVLVKAIDSLDIEKTPWLNFEYTLPQGSLWSVQINAKVDTNGIGASLTLLSPPVKGGGKNTLLLNLNDMLHQAKVDAKGGHLKDLLIHFVLDRSSQTSEDARIELGKLTFYRAEQPAQGNLLARKLVVPDPFNPTNLAGLFEKQKGIENELTILSGNFVHSSMHTGTNLGATPKLSLQENFQNKLPKLFVGEDFYLNNLTGKELDAVLDQRLFLEKQLLWQSGQSDVIFLNQLPQRNTEMDSLVLIDYKTDIALKDNTFLVADYAFESDKELPLYLTLTGIDSRGRPVTLDKLLLKRTPIELSNFKLKNMTISFRNMSASALKIDNDKQNTLSDFPKKVDISSLPPTSLVVNNIQISTFKKIDAYRPSASVALISIDKVAVPQISDSVIWHAVPEQIDLNTHAGLALQTAKFFMLNQKITGDAVLNFNIEAPNLDLVFIKLKGSDKFGYFETLIPVNRQGSWRVHDIDLQSLELMVRGGEKSEHTSIMLKQIDIAPSATSIPGEVVLPGSKTTNQTIYLAPHYSQSVASRSDRTTLPPNPNMFMPPQTIDTTLTYEEVINGGRVAKLPKALFLEGPYKLDYITDEDISLNLETANHIKITHPLMDQDKNIRPPIIVPTLVWIVLAASLIYMLSAKIVSIWPLKGMPSYILETGFWMAEFALLTASALLFFTSKNHDAFSWGSIILVMAYGFAVRHKIRPYLEKQWGYFAAKRSAPYFILFLVLFLACAILFTFNQKAAENIAVIGYFLLITGVLIEFIEFSRDASVDKVK